MGSASSKIQDKPVIYLENDNCEFFFNSIIITDLDDQFPICIKPNTCPATSFNDPEASSYDLSPFLLKLYLNQEINVVFNITFKLHTFEKKSSFIGLAFIYGTNASELDNILASESENLMNFHDCKNVLFMTDLLSDDLLEKKFEWSWKWTPPSAKDQHRDGWRNTCYLIVYFWVEGCEKRFQNNTNFYFNQKSPSLSSHIETSVQNNTNDQKESLSSGKGNISFNSLLDNMNSVVNFNHFDDAFKNEPNDGPLFRAIITALEKKTSVFGYRIKKVIKRAIELYDSQIAKNEANRRFMSALRKAAESNPTALKPVLILYLETANQQLQSFEYNNAIQLQSLIIKPLRRIYETDIKVAEGKKKSFEDDSHDYYQFVSRYLSRKKCSSKDKKNHEADIKYSVKRRNFELKRFDYYSYMQDVSGGKKEQEILHLFTLYVENHFATLYKAIKVILDLKPGLDNLTQGVQEANKNIMHLCTEREERRQALEKSKIFVQESNYLFSSVAQKENSKDLKTQKSCLALYDYKSQNDDFYSNLNKLPSMENIQISNLSNPDNGDISEGIKDSTKNNIDNTFQRRKEGLLWALSRPGSHIDLKVTQKLNWHKYWIVLAGGKLCEYQNWKQAIDLHNNPIDLRMASVRKVCAFDRRFCFEVITPKIRRVYQATSEEDVFSWINSISRAIESLLEGTSSASNLCLIKEDIQRSDSKLLEKEPDKNVSDLNNEDYKNIEGNAYKLLNIIHDADPTHNVVCADCGTFSKAEWCSINIPAILCIECSGVHRSFGSHISKVRSLMLDTASFTDSLIDFICQTGNKMTNSIYEATYDSQKNIKNITKPLPNSSREEKQKYIYAKYIDKVFIIYDPNPTKSLFLGISNKHIKSVMQALASGADPNAVDPETQDSALLLSLFSSLQNSRPNLNNYDCSQKIMFPIAEYLLQNGAKLPESPLSISQEEKLSFCAKLYLQNKYAKSYSNDENNIEDSSNVGSSNTLLSVTKNSSNNLSFFFYERKNSGKLHKKLNSSGKLSKLL
ncbi:unnamed protein product [Pneumocystis jirovecii]|uniref:ADP-ribosylation factor GTPase-activating protein n=1 Tax=Pneumocystis jirovecii TaxID=42068 RepID=L0PB30_PNEJI|nr:unnamed protein product [Pneumocystis jirovecii]